MLSALSTAVTDLTTRSVHDTYYPYTRLAALHAFKVALVWAGMTRGKARKNVGVVGDLFGYLCLAWGGGSIVAALLGTPPAWLVSPGPWMSYIAIYLALVPTRLASMIDARTPPVVLAVIGALIDGLARGNTVAALPSLLSTSAHSSTHNAWATALLSGIACSGGGWLVSSFGLHESSWQIGKPAILNGGVWNTLDLWAGMVCGAINSALLRSHTELDPLSSRIAAFMPAHTLSVGASTGGGAVVTTETARAVIVALMGGLILLRVFAVSGVKAPVGRAGVDKVVGDVKAAASRAATPLRENVSDRIRAATPAPPSPSPARKRKNAKPKTG